jgi:hypothetical protein
MESKQILQEEANKIGDILEKKKLSDEKRLYFTNLQKCMIDRIIGSRKPVKKADKEAFLQSVCDKILEKRMLMKKGGVNHNLSLVKGRTSVSVANKELEKKQKEIIRKRMIMMNKTLKHQKLPTIPKYKGDKKSQRLKSQRQERQESINGK